MQERDLGDPEVQAAVRQVADDYLDDDNINSVGVGYKETDGERTEELVLQFTVGQKLAPEALEAAPTREIPKAIEANGITFATDVIERDFAPHLTERRARVNPMAPGVSIGHVNVSAGTLGCFVQENGSRDLRVLSNWHVLDGGGSVGDAIAQPGRADDPSTAANLSGRLVRSFVGFEGDCAIASIVGRDADQTILGLGTAVRRIADPALGDLVVKSGRTTGVTHGVVTRVQTITKLSYRSVGEKRVFGFEIGPDPSRPAPDDEISMGGDSGSSWMAADASGAAKDTMLGLHFAGETVRSRARGRLLRDEGVREARHQPRRRPADARPRAGGSRLPAGVPARRAGGAPGTRAAGRRGRLRADGVERRRPRLHALLARDELRTPVLSLGGVERRRQRADPAVPHQPEVRHRSRVRPAGSRSTTGCTRATGSTAATSRAAPISCGARAPRPSGRTPTRSSSRTSPRSSTTSTSRAGRACGGSSRTRSTRTSTSTISA